MKANPILEKLQRWCLRIIAVLGTVIFLVLTVCSWYRTRTMLAGEFMETHRDVFWKTMFVFLGVLLTVLAVIKAERFFSARALHIIAIVISLGAALFGFFLMNSLQTYAVADQWYVYEAARKLADGSFDIQEYAGYYQIYSFQLNLAQIYELIFRITGESGYRILQGVHGVCVGFILYMGFRITGELFHRRAAELVYLVLGMLFVPMYIYMLYIYGETPGTCFAMVAIWCFLKYNSCETVRGVLGYGLLGMAAIAGLYQVRVGLMVVWIAMLLIQILMTIEKRKYLPLVMTVCMVFGAVCVSGALRISMENRTGVALDKRMPTVLWIAMGLQDSIDSAICPGSYNAYNWNVFTQSGLDESAAADTAMKYIRDRMTELVGNPAEAITFFGRKALNQWNEPTYACFIMTGFSEQMDEWVRELYYGEKNAVCLSFLNEYQAVVYLAVLLGFVRLVGRKREPREYLIGLILVGEFLFSMMWEASSRYVYPYAVIMVPFAACSLMNCCDAIVAKIKKKREVPIS